MYYNSNQNNNDYYSAYKEEMANANNAQSSTFNQILKVGLIILFLGLLAVGVLYFFNYFSNEMKENSSTVSSSKLAQTNNAQIKKEVSSAIKVSENRVPQNSGNNSSIKETISSVTGSSNINPKDIELIVKIIMSQMKQAPQEKIATNTNDNLEKQLVAAEKQVMKKQTLKESNHYNKVVVSSNEPVTETSNKLMQLQNSLNDAIEENSEENSEKSESSNYTQAISKEVDIRSNEMRVIVVQKGDTLSKIAKKAYGNYDDYVKIFNANPEVVKNPDEIFVGQRLRIPS